MRRFAHGRIAGSVQDVYPAPIAPAVIELSAEHAGDLLGVDLTPRFIQTTLKRLDFKPVRQGKGSWLVQCPTYRADMELEADLIEEIARFHGYQNIPATVPAGMTVGEPSLWYPYERSVRAILLGMGYSECINLSFANQLENRCFPLAEGLPLQIRNPLTEDTQFMRGWLAPGLTRSAKQNFNHNQRSVRLFEVGKRFRRAEDGAVVERDSLGILGTGSLSSPNWLGATAEYDFFQLKGTVMALLSGLRCAPAEILPIARIHWLDEAACAAIVIGDRRMGLLGRLHPDLEEEFKLKQAVYIAEIDFQELYKHVFSPVRFEPLPRFPSVERDISIVVSNEFSYHSLRQGILELKVPELSALDLIDVYEGGQIPAGRVSMTLRLTFMDREGTLTVDRVQGFSDNIRSYLRDHFGAENR
jgi:phenylalanyl-tRNA synthetase beta chain